MRNCRDIDKQIDAYLAGEFGLFSSLDYRFHLLICQYCRCYVRQYQCMLETMAHNTWQASDQDVQPILELLQYKGDRNEK